jgi:hypothetical protein
MNGTIPINQEEAANKLKSYFDNNQRLIAVMGFGAGMYLLGRFNGFKNGYIKGYNQNFMNVIQSARNVK